MKKQFALIAILGILSAMTGCGSTEKDNTAPKTDTPRSTASAETTTTAVTSKAENTTAAETSKNEKAAETPKKVSEKTAKNASFEKIAGTWYEDNAEFSRTINVNTDGSYTVDCGGTSPFEGSIWCENRDGVEWFSFFDIDRGLWYSFQLLTIDGEEKLVSEDNALDSSYYFSRTKHEYFKDPNAPVANVYGLYPINDPPATSISVASLAGKWQNTDFPSEVYNIYATDDLYKGTFTCSYDGVVSIQGYVLYESTTPELSGDSDRFTFYNNEGSLIEGFDVTGEIPLNDLYEKFYGSEHFVRIE